MTDFTYALTFGHSFAALYGADMLMQEFYFNIEVYQWIYIQATLHKSISHTVQANKLCQVVAITSRHLQVARLRDCCRVEITHANGIDNNTVHSVLV